MNPDRTITCAFCYKRADERETVRSLFGGGIEFSAGELHLECAKVLEAAPGALQGCKAALRAIAARVNGVWDDPDLIAFGPLGMMDVDVVALVNAAIAERGKSRA